MGSKVAIIYFSATGNTEAMAEAVAVGARNTGAEVLLAPVSDVDPIEIGNTCHVVSRFYMQRSRATSKMQD